MEKLKEMRNVMPYAPYLNLKLSSSNAVTRVIRTAYQTQDVAKTARKSPSVEMVNQKETRNAIKAKIMALVRFPPIFSHNHLIFFI